MFEMSGWMVLPNNDEISLDTADLYLRTLPPCFVSL